jgi:hypothetical protein
MEREGNTLEYSGDIVNYSRDFLDEQPIWCGPGGHFSVSDSDLLPLVVGMEEAQGLVTNSEPGTHAYGFPSGALFLTQNQTSFGPDLALTPEEVPLRDFFPSPPENLLDLLPSHVDIGGHPPIPTGSS